MTSTPPLIVSNLDAQRLERLLTSEVHKHMPGIYALMNEVDRATIVEPTEVPSDIVTMNSTVRFIDDTTGAESQLTLVYPGEAGPPDSVSVLAPVGSALLGMSVGQSIEWSVPGGRRLKLRVLKVVRQPEAMGEYHR